MTTNFVGPEGVVAIAEMLRCNTTLRELSLSDNNIGEQGDRGASAVRDLAAALEANTTLDLLDLTFNSLSTAAADTLKSAKHRSDLHRESPLELRL